MSECLSSVVRIILVMLILVFLVFNVVKHATLDMKVYLCASLTSSVSFTLSVIVCIFCECAVLKLITTTYYILPVS